MSCDVRYLHQEDVPVVWSKVRKYLGNAEVSRDDGEWFLRIEGRGWKFDSHARGFVFKDGKLVDYSQACVFMDYYPPNGGSIRFDSHVHPDAARSHPSFEWQAKNFASRPGEIPYWSFCDQLIREYGEALVQRGSAGKNRVGYFEPVPAAASELSFGEWLLLGGVVVLVLWALRTCGV